MLRQLRALGTGKGELTGRQQQLHSERQQRQGRGLQGAAGVEGNPEVSELLCDLGSDCSDCGPWVGTVPEGWGEHGGPVAWARAAHNASLFVRRTATPRPFLAAIAHHKADPDVSAMLWHYGAMEGGVTRIMHQVLDGQCDPGGGQRRRLVVDVGASFGYYTVQAALYGCRVVAFEPVPKFRALLEWTVHAAGVAALVDVLPLALGEAEGPLQLRLPRDGVYWGLASVNGVNLMPNEVMGSITVNGTTLDSWEVWAPPDAKPADVLLLKMDLEGWEAPVLRGGSKLLAHVVDNVLLEYSPGIYERLNMTHLAPQRALPSSLLSLATTGFALAHLPLFSFAAPWPPLKIDPAQPLPPFEEVTAAALQHDLEALDYREVQGGAGRGEGFTQSVGKLGWARELRMEVSPGGCPLPPELLERFPVWRHCREWTYGTHPKGFRSAFGFNTNLWASRRASEAAKRHMRLQGSATLFDEGQDMKVWTSLRRPGAALGLVNCTAIGSGHLQLFRCPCPPEAPAACMQERDLVARLADEGRMPFTLPISADGKTARAA
ncbi:hypothetical protein GPECTOR_7g1011 [Gonium pectorale]|uniref:Methyltransferase FkbM domain-containing protein n=1 Tax=Gonium pectorale TaxID=33097 RepID=A0A150GUW6_GONPE|nr:hypothetical protein GPECTOR_7g1011 [Gonium pectorale]|eukprot:KXZ53120.1 hypothetical protein GPECTOR_7g1011 [Gonium pectorale]